MLALRLILVFALVAQLGAAFRCCPASDNCNTKDELITCCSAGTCGVPLKIKSCCASQQENARCSHGADHGQSNHDTNCPCCKEHLLGSKRPMDAAPSPEELTLVVFATPMLAPDFDQFLPQRELSHWLLPQVLPRAINRRLAQLSVWRT